MSIAIDRVIHPLERAGQPWPLPPLNFFCRSGYERGSLELQWDDPSIHPGNGAFKVLGVNLYRSFDSDFGPFERVNDLPLGSTYYQDKTELALLEEDVSASFVQRGVYGDPSNPPRYVFTTRHPILQAGTQGVPAFSPSDVRVWVNDVLVPVIAVRGPSAEVELDPWPRVDIPTQTLVQPPRPTVDDKVVCAYRYAQNLVKTDLNTRIFYRVTSVGVDTRLPGFPALVETPLGQATTANRQEIEKLDYIWREAIHRSRWILDQGGERVKVYIRKTVGVRCTCFQDAHHKQPLNDCKLCYGTGVIGGYEGPFNIIIAPDDAEKRLNQTAYGRTVEHMYEVWTGPSPLLSHRDFILKQNGSRYSVGPVRTPSNRGQILQQHFTIAHVDETDIRYRIPFGSPLRLPVVTVDTLESPDGVAPPEVTDHPRIGDDREERGRTKAWENINF